jgi:TRAP-type mannitol/chloroaromatic compound transport system substrate-binding protein
MHTIVNLDKWNSLPKHYQAALSTACAEANTWMPAKYDTVNVAALRRLVAGGTQLRPFPRAVMQAAEKAAYELYDTLGQKSKHWARMYPDWLKFRNDEFLWFRVAEGTYDNYAFNSPLGRGAGGNGKPAGKKK